MIRLIYLVLAFILLTDHYSSGQSTKYFIKNIGDTFPMIEEGKFVKVLGNGYLTGGTQFVNSPNCLCRYNIIKTDKYGQVVNQVISQDTSLVSILYDASVLNDSWVFTGSGKYSSMSKTQTILIKTDTLGNLIWQTLLGDTTRTNRSYSINATFDGGFILGGSVLINPINVSEGQLIKVDSLGNEEWIRVFPGTTSHMIIWHVFQNPDSTFTFVGCKDCDVMGGQIWLVHTDLDGYEVTNHTYTFQITPNSNYNAGYFVQKHPLNGYIITGITGSGGFTSTGVIFKTDQFGQIDWSKVLNQEPDGSGNPWSSYIHKSTILTDYSIVAAGTMATFLTPSLAYYEAFLIKLDSSGNEMWRRKFTYDSNYDSYGWDMEPTDDGGFIIAGRAEGPGIGADLFLIKVNCLGFADAPEADFSVSWNGDTATFYNLSLRADTCIYYFGDGDSAVVHLTDTTPVIHVYSGPGPWQSSLVAFACGEEDTLNQTITTSMNDFAELVEKTFKIYPNPSVNKLTVSYIIVPEAKNPYLLIYDIHGRLIQSIPVNSSNREMILDVSSFQTGSYHIVLQADEMRKVTRKMMVVN